MREAPALAGATRARPRPASGAKPKTTPRTNASSATLLGRAFARPGVTIAGAVFAALMTGIVANAMLFQKGHRPAPLLKPNTAVPPVDPPAAPVRAELSPPPAAPAPVPAAPADVPAAPAAAPVVAPAPPAKPMAAARPHKAAAHHAHHDSIGDLIGTLAQDAHKAAKQGGSVAKPPSHPTPAKTPAHLAKDAAPSQQ